MVSADENKYPEILQELRESLESILLEEGLEPERAAAAAFRAAEHIRKAWGGQSPYIPKGQDFELSERDLQIYREFNGRNLHEICQRYQITKQRVYQIYNVVHSREFKKRQPALFPEGAEV